MSHSMMKPEHRVTVRTDNEPVGLGTDGTSAGELEHHGITCVTTFAYEWGGYRYSNASDAITAAKRAGR